MNMRPEKDPEREHRIIYEIVVDCYDEYERVAGWWCYLDNILQFPFKATCIAERSVSMLNVGEKVQVLGMSDQDDCEREMMVQIAFKKREFGVPLMQLAAIDADDDTVQAIEDWHYWTHQGYDF